MESEIGQDIPGFSPKGNGMFVSIEILLLEVDSKGREMDRPGRGTGAR